MKNLINSHGLMDGDIVKCIKTENFAYNAPYFKVNEYYIVCNISHGLQQTDNHEIFLSTWNNTEKKIKFIGDSAFSQCFILDVKKIRKQKLEKLFN